jgi:hypothetical protein
MHCFNFWRNLNDINCKKLKIMKKSITALFLFCTLLLSFSPWFTNAQPTEAEIETSIQAGINYLINGTHPQFEEGFWAMDEGVNEVAYTGIVLMKLCEYAYEKGYESPFDPEYDYSQNVTDGFNYLFTKVRDTYEYAYSCEGIEPGSISMEGMYISDEPVGAQPEMYNATLATMALGACNTPNKIIDCSGSPAHAMTHFELMQEMVDFYRWAQNKESSTTNFGGWGNRPWLAPFCCVPFDQQNPDAGCMEWGNTYSDNASSGYVVFALQYAEEMGCAIPYGLKEDLSVWIDYIQIEGTISGTEEGAGGSGYFSDDFPEFWHNSLRTGNLLAEMAFAGYPLEHSRVQSALSYIGTYWETPPAPNLEDLTTNEGWAFWPMAMYSLMKGLKSYGLKTITVDGNERNWYNEFSTQLLGDVPKPPAPTSEQTWQFWSGNWAWGWWGDDITNTCWALLILEGALPDYVAVDVDFHPTSWPNPLNIDLNGVFPMAILGTENFDVTTIDPASVKLEGVAPLRWALEDVTTPVAEGPCNATTLGADGFTDLTFKFDNQELVTVLGEVNDGDELVLTITGSLLNGQPIQGEDCIRIKANEKKSAKIEKDDPQNFSIANYPNPFAETTRIQFSLSEETHVFLKVFDLQGKAISILADKNYLPGTYTIRFDAVGLSPGNYYYSITTNNNKQTKRMVLIK